MENNLDIKKFKEISRSFVIEIIYSAQDSHKAAFKEERERNDLIAGIMLSNAISTNNSMKGLYYQNPDFEHQEFEAFFAGFDIYKNELLTNIRTGHSHQWTDIEFRSFIEKAIPLTQLLDMQIGDKLREILSEQ